jgi:sensor histidine kinase YesM
MAHRRSIFLINKKFQLTFSFYVCSWLFALSLVYPLIIYNLFDYFFRYAQVDPLGPNLAVLQRTRKEILWLLVLLQVVFLNVTFLISIFMSHRIAGPLHKLRLIMASVAKGNLAQEAHFRKKDHFQEVADDFNSMLASIRSLMGPKGEAIAAAITQIEQAIPTASSEARPKLEAALASLRQAR